MKIGIIGGGIMGLTVAYELSKQGISVILFEKQDVLGGLAASFDLHGQKLEKYYHFICLPDKSYINFLKELGLGSRLKWRAAKMSYFYNGKFYPWGDPLSLITFPLLNFSQKFRYGLNVLYSKFTKNWGKLEDLSAVEWLTASLGKETYDIFWKALLEHKFGKFANDISAAWIWSRIKRVANSRESVFKDYYGYIEGGTQLFINKLIQEIKHYGGEIKTSSAVTEIVTKSGRVGKVLSNGQEYKIDLLVSTIPLPAFINIKIDLPADFRSKLERIRNIGITCGLFLLKKPLTDNYWLNVSDPRMDIPGLIEFTNLNSSLLPAGQHLVYLPQYVSAVDPIFSLSDRDFFAKGTSWLKILNPAIRDEDIIDFRFFKERYAQPIPERGFTRILPEIKTPVNNLLIADTSYFFPEDRSIDQSVAMGRNLVQISQKSVVNDCERQ